MGALVLSSETPAHVEHISVSLDATDVQLK